MFRAEGFPEGIFDPPRSVSVSRSVGDIDNPDARLHEERFYGYRVSREHPYLTALFRQSAEKICVYHCSRMRLLMYSDLFFTFWSLSLASGVIRTDKGTVLSPFGLPPPWLPPRGSFVGLVSIMIVGDVHMMFASNLAKTGVC